MWQIGSSGRIWYIFGWVGMTIISYQTINFKIVISSLVPSVAVYMPVMFPKSFPCTDYRVLSCCIFKLPLKHIWIQNVTYHLPFYYKLLLLGTSAFFTPSSTTHHLLLLLLLFLYFNMNTLEKLWRRYLYRNLKNK